jgi:GTP-binding protein
MKIESADFVTSCLELSACPSSTLLEFAFVGRSNVGKSSLINMLTSRKELAHTSSKPGKTQCMNYFRINNRWHLVDLPGYGYAKVSKSKKFDFNRYVSAYLTERPNLKQVFLLVDSQLEPQDGDLAFAEWLEQCGVPYSIILTKTDRCSENRVRDHAGRFEAVIKEMNFKPSEIFRCSAKTGKGRGQILSWIDQQLPKAAKKKNKGTRINLGWMQK